VEKSQRTATDLTLQAATSHIAPC